MQRVIKNNALFFKFLKRKRTSTLFAYSSHNYYNFVFWGQLPERRGFDFAKMWRIIIIRTCSITNYITFWKFKVIYNVDTNIKWIYNFIITTEITQNVDVIVQH